MKLEYRFPKPVDKIYPFIADFEKFGSLHPYMNKIVKIPGGYRVYEIVPLFGLQKLNEYQVQVDEPVPLQTVCYRSKVNKFVSLEILFEFSTREMETIVVETITINSFVLVRWMMERVMKKAHIQLFAKLSTL